MKADKTYCLGCSQNYYNGNNEVGIKECWSFKSAKAVTRFRIGWWTIPDSKDRFTKVTTNSCHIATGRYADHEKLPAHVTQR